MKDQRFPQKVQAAGWVIRSLTQSGIIAACPRPGCTVKVSLQEDLPIPHACAAIDTKEIMIEGNEAVRLALRARRLQLGLTIPDVENIAGMADTHLAKAEKENPSRSVGIDTLTLWAGALGFDVILRPKPLTAKALRVLGEKSLNRQSLMRRS